MEEKSFFTLEDDFEGIINLKIDNVLKINKIETGWTNFVFIAKTKNQSYVFRFPRNNFFATALLKEFEFTKFIKNKVMFNVPNQKLLYNFNRPYTMHKMIKGTSLTYAYASCTIKQKEALAQDIVKFLKEMQNIDYNNEKTKFENVSSFLDRLSEVSGDGYELKKHYVLKKLEKKELVVSHGDFNPGNLLVDKNNKLVAVLDFAFGGLSHPYNDISRMFGRMPKDFEKYFIDALKNNFNKKINFNNISKLNKMWAYVEERYINYIKENHKDIILPN